MNADSVGQVRFHQRYLLSARAGSQRLIPIGLQPNFRPSATMLAGLNLFGVVFALNSSVHSYLADVFRNGSCVHKRRLITWPMRVADFWVRCCRAFCTNRRVSPRRVVLAGLAGVGAMFLPPVVTDVGWAGARGDD